MYTVNDQLITTHELQPYFLENNALMTDVIMNAVAYSFSTAKTLVMSSFLFNEKTKVKRWTKKALKNQKIVNSKVERILIPFNESKNHWVVYHVKRSGQIEIIGSLLDLEKDKKVYKENKAKCLLAARVVWGNEYKIIPPSIMRNTRQPLKTDQYSCGIHAIWYLHMASKGYFERFPWREIRVPDRFLHNVFLGKRWILGRLIAQIHNVKK